jgi:hypothetical protein
LWSLDSIRASRQPSWIQWICCLWSKTGIICWKYSLQASFSDSSFFYLVFTFVKCWDFRRE